MHACVHVTTEVGTRHLPLALLNLFIEARSLADLRVHQLVKISHQRTPGIHPPHVQLSWGVPKLRIVRAQQTFDQLCCLLSLSKFIFSIDEHPIDYV